MYYTEKYGCSYSWSWSWCSYEGIELESKSLLGIHCMRGSSTWAKWPISINIWNIWARNTVWEIYREIPLFVVLELGELEYPIFLFQRGTWRWHLNLKNTLGTRAHEARVLLSHYPTLKTIFYIFYPQQ